MDDLSDDGSESAKSDITVVSNPAMKKKSPLEKVQTIDVFIATAEGTIAEAEELLGQYPGSYDEEIEVQHLTVKDTLHTAERFLYRTPHTEEDRITHTVKKLWHINNRYAYRQRQAEKKQPPLQPVVTPRISPIPQVRNFSTVAKNFPIPENCPSVSNSPTSHTSSQFLAQQLEQEQKVAQENFRREPEAHQNQLRYYKERMQTVKEKERAARSDADAFLREQWELAIRIQQLEAKIHPSITAIPCDINGEYDTTFSYSNTHILQSSTPVTHIPQVPKVTRNNFSTNHSYRKSAITHPSTNYTTNLTHSSNRKTTPQFNGR